MKLGNKNSMVHGEHGTVLYKKWKSMRGRVNSNPHYIKHGIKCCDEWANYLVFKAWAISNGYISHLSIDRVDTNGNYEPSNCRWVNKTTQAENSRIRKDNSTGYRGVSYDTKSGKYKVQIQVSKKKVYLGRFDNIVDAALSYDNYVKSIGSNHTLNF